MRTERSTAPAWVRLCLFGIPDRRTAMTFYWLFVVIAAAFPALELLPPRITGGAAVAGSLFSVFALWSTARAVRWLDRHGWDRLP